MASNSSAPPTALGPQEEDQLLLRIYHAALVTRAVDERLWVLSRQGRASFVLTGRGHEIAQVASVAAMRRGHDSAWLYYRDQAAAVMLGVTPYEIFLGCMARADDPHSGGRQLSAHFSSPRLRIGSVSSAVAAHLPHAVGAAYAARVRNEDSVAVCFFGDGAASEGDTHEAMNLASVYKLPVVFICENNGYAISTPLALQMAVGAVSDRAAAYGMPGMQVDGTDARAVYLAVSSAIEMARAGHGPSLIEARVPRMTAHSSQDDDSYRDDDQRAEALAADPIPKLRRELTIRGLLDEAQDEAMLTAIRAEVMEAAERAWEKPESEGWRARRWLYSGDAEHEYLAELERQGPPSEA